MLPIMNGTSMLFVVPHKNNIRNVRRASIRQTFVTETPPKPTVSAIQRLFKTCRKYWYVAVPVHILNSSIMFAGCYYITESGFDIIKELEKLHVRQDVIDFFTHSGMGHLTVTFALYKLLAPIRIATTIYVSKTAIRYLTRTGLITSSATPFRR